MTGQAGDARQLEELPDTHDMRHLQWALSHVDNFGVAIDGGAHQGIWTRELMRHFDEVIAFEPVASNRRMIPQGARTYPYALGDKHGSVDVRLMSNAVNTGMYHVTPGDRHTMVTLDELDEFEIDCDFLKLDIEGYELHALRGARRLLMRCKPVVLIEDNGTCTYYGIKQMESDEYLKRIGYSCLGRMNADFLYKWTGGAGATHGE